MTKQEHRFSPAVLIGDGLLLLCAVAGLAGSFLSLYGGPDAAAWADMSALERCAGDMALFLSLSALSALASLCAWSLPRFRGAAAGGLAGLWALAVYRSWEDALSGAALTCKAIADLFCARVDWGRTFPYEHTLTPAQAAAHTRLFLLLALALLALALGWAVVRARRWWLALLLTLPPLLPGLAADFYPGWPAFMALSACWCVMLLTGLCKWASPSGRGKLTLAVLPAVALVLGALTLLMPMEGYTRPLWALRAEEELHAASNRASGFFSRWDGPFQSTITYVGAAETVDLTAAGPLRYTGRSVLRVSGDYETGLLYLRGSSLAVYTGKSWMDLPDGTYQRFLDGQDDFPSPLIFPSLLSGHVQEHTITVDNVGAVGTCVYAPYFLTGQDWRAAGLLPVRDSHLAAEQGRWKHTMSYAELQAPRFASGQYAAYRGFVYENYLDVPSGLRQELEALCAGYGLYEYGYGGPGPVDVAQRVAGLLDELCEYDQDTPLTPAKEDFVDYFLTQSRRGYCMHFASAATLMLRTLGIPARYVSGFAAPVREGSTATFPDRAAHAWVEIYLDGFGWYPVEVTPDAAFEGSREGGILPGDLPLWDPAELSTPAPESGAPDEPTPTPTSGPTPAPSDGLPVEGDGIGLPLPGDGPGTAAAFTLPSWVKWAALAAAVLALTWLGQFVPKRVRARRMDGPDRNRAALVCCGYLQRLSRWGGRIDPRAVELAEKAKFSQHTLTREELDELRAFVDLERTRLCVVLGPVQRLLLRYWWGMPMPPSVLRRVPPLGIRERDGKNDPQNPSNP